MLLRFQISISSTIEALKAFGRCAAREPRFTHQQVEHLKLVIEKLRRMIFGAKSREGRYPG